MVECYKCGVSDERERLFDAISNKGLIKICRNCSEDEGLPLVQPVDLNKPEKVKSVYERLSAMANLDPNKHRQALVEKAKEDSIGRYRQNREKIRQDNTTLKGVIDSNFEKKKGQARSDLVSNFHWILMRSRRAKKLTQKQLADNIGESVTLIVNAENGTILSNSDTLVRKLENYLGVKIMAGESPYSSSQSRGVKPGISEDPEAREIRERFVREGKFDAKTAEALTIADLKEMDKQEEHKSSGGFFSFLKRKKKPAENSEEDPKQTDISDEEANEILYGK